jgi:hypothetical protein
LSIVEQRHELLSIAVKSPSSNWRFDGAAR